MEDLEDFIHNIESMDDEEIELEFKSKYDPKEIRSKKSLSPSKKAIRQKVTPQSTHDPYRQQILGEMGVSSEGFSLNQGQYAN